MGDRRRRGEGAHALDSSLAELEAFRDSINSGSTGAGESFELTADIDLSAKYSETTGVSWEPIGTDIENGFQGTFNGGGHTISGLYINKTGSGDEYGFDFGALFGLVKGGSIQNLNVQGCVSVAASDGEAAGIAVSVQNGAIMNCSFDGIVECPNYIACGITAEESGSVISGCKTSGKIVGQHLVAGIVGTCYGEDDCVITNCVNESEITSTVIAGGIAAWGQGTLDFNDAEQVSGYAQDAMRWAVEQGILQGKGGGILDPQGAATRAEAAVMLMRFCSLGN